MGTQLQSILVVDDDPAVRAQLGTLLGSEAGLLVHCTPSGDAALAAATGLEPDLLLIDAFRAQSVGLTTLEHLRCLPHLEATPVLFAVGAFTGRELQRYLEAGAIGVLPKPFVPALLAEQVQTLWQQHFARNIAVHSH